MSSDTAVLKIDVEEPKAWTRLLKITVPADRVDRERDSVARRLSQSVRLPGFRKGKVPAGVITRKFGAAIQSEAVERIVDEAYREALQEKGFQPISEGQVDDVAYEPGQDLTFQVQFDVRPEIELTRVSGFAVQRPDATIGDDDVGRVLARLQSENASWSAVEDGRPERGERVVVEITPVKTDSDEQPSKARRYQIVLGEGQAIEDVEKAIETLSVGESGEFLIQVPAAQGEGTEEQKVRIDLNQLEKAELPELDDEFAKTVGEFDSLDALRSTVRQDLEREAESEAERTVRRALIDQIIEANPFEVPDSMVAHYLQSMFPPREDIPQEQLEQMWASAQPGAERAIRRSLVVERVAEQQSLQASTEEVDARVEEIAERAGRPVGEVWAQLQRSGRLQGLENEILEDKVFTFLQAQSTIEVAPAAEPAAETETKAEDETETKAESTTKTKSKKRKTKKG